MSAQTYKGYKHFFIDVETTGTDRQLHNVFQVSGILTDENYNTLEKCDLRFKPFSLDHVEQGALEKTGMTLETLNTPSLNSLEAYMQFTELLSRHCNKFDKKDKIHFVAYNANFDADFIRAWFSKHGDNYFGSWFWHPPICVMGMMTWITQRVRGALPNFKLSTLCQCAEIEWDESKAHDAKYDIKKTMELFMYAKKFMPSL